MAIHFPNVEAIDAARAVVTFPAHEDDRKFQCAISLEALEDNFEGDAAHPLAAFRKHRKEIERLAEQIIYKQRYEPDGSVLIRSRDG